MIAMNNQAYIGLGSNLGNRVQNLETALVHISQHKLVSIKKVSPVYESNPIGGPAQGNFLNACLEISTSLSPVLLLETILAIENVMGRVRNVRWGPRNIDIDLLIYGNIVMDTPMLILPHPRLTEREFVIVPLSDIGYDTIVPGKCTTVGAIKETFGPVSTLKHYTSFNLERLLGKDN